MRYEDLNFKVGDIFRRKRWPDGVVGSLLEDGTIDWFHVAACSISPPPAEEFEKDDWIIVENYGRDIGYQT